MTEPMPCPSCAGLSQPGHPAGPLGGWHHGQACPLLELEDARTVADADALDRRRVFVRPSTPTESTLLAALGWTWPTTEPLMTTVVRLTASIRGRLWLDATAPTTQGAPPT